MADIEVNYKGSTIASTSTTGTKTLLTSGKYCEDDIEISYTKPSSSYIILKSKEGALLTCGSQTYQLQSGETEHIFSVDLGTYILTSTWQGYVATDTLLVDISGVYNVGLYPSKLPNQYQEVGFIEATGTQYINTNLALGDNFKIELSFAQTTLDRNNEQPIISTWISSKNYFNLFIPANQYRLDFYTAGHHYLNAIMSINEKYDITIQRNSSSWELNFEGETINYEYNGSENNTTVKLLSRGDLAGAKTGAIYGCKIYKNGVLERNFVPCYEKSTYNTGMYDLVNNTFYANAGTGEFIVGGNV